MLKRNIFLICAESARKAEKKTTYTVLWKAASSVNDVAGAKVTAKLPPYVSWESKISPSDEDITYDKSTGVVTWAIGTLRAGVGYKMDAREVAFQIGLTPSVAQVGTSPVLIEDATLSGRDGFANVSVSTTHSEQSTVLQDDGGFNSGDGRVVD